MSEQFKKKSKSITLAHIHDLVLSWLDTGTLIKSGRVELVFFPDLHWFLNKIYNNHHSTYFLTRPVPVRRHTVVLQPYVTWR